MRRLALFLALCALALPGGAAPAISGEQRLLFVMLTWGPEPFSAAAARNALAETDSYIRSASFGRASVSGDVTGWLRALPSRPACQPAQLEPQARAAAAAAGFDPSSYTRLVIAFPELECSWGGAYFNDQVWLNGYVNRHVLAHELGHVGGVPEEGPALVGGVQQNYANPYSVMGHGWGDFGAYEKLTFGWISVERLAAPRELALGAIDRPVAGPQGLRVATARDEYWFEYRPPQPRHDYDEPAATPGVVVYGSPRFSAGGGRFASRNLMLADPVGAGRPSLRAGESFTAPGVFSLSVAEAGADSARVRFAWTDRTRPRAPRVTVRGRRVTWSAAPETGSGLSFYEVRVDRGRPRRVAAFRRLGEIEVEGDRAFTAPRGRHRVTVVAVDAAGNRGLPALARTR